MSKNNIHETYKPLVKKALRKLHIKLSLYVSSVLCILPICLGLLEIYNLAYPYEVPDDWVEYIIYAMPWIVETILQVLFICIILITLSILILGVLILPNLRNNKNYIVYLDNQMYTLLLKKKITKNTYLYYQRYYNI